MTDLGVWDQNNDGLSESHLVTIWTSTGTFVTSATVPSGTSGALVDEFRYLSIAPTLLLAGDYVIGAYYGAPADIVAADAVSITTASGVTYTGSRAGAGSALPPGDAFVFSNAYFGPNFQFTTELDGRLVPDASSTWMLMLLGLTGAFGLNFLRRLTTFGVQS